MDLLLVDSQIKDLELEVKEGDTLRLNLASFHEFPTCKIQVNVRKNAVLDVAFADLGHGKGTFTFVANLEEGASAEFHASSLSSEKDNKVLDTSVHHLEPNTYALMSNYGITRDTSKLTFTGTSKIHAGAKGSNTRQVAKIIIFDPTCDGKASPILKIDENDVSASHAATVGRLNDEHLFYLLSRGLSDFEAKRLITLGYLKPVEEHFFDEAMRQKIDEAIEGGV